MSTIHRLYQRIVEPFLALKRRKRLATFGPIAGALPRQTIDWRRGADCRPPCPLDPTRVPRLVRRYTDGRLTPMTIALDDLPDLAGFEALLRQRSSSTMRKIRKAGRSYVTHPFWLNNHIADLHAIKTSCAFRAAGPVLDRWFLKPAHIGVPAAERVTLGRPTCPMHWQMLWGVFAPEPGHLQNGVEMGERLVGFVRLMRIGDVVHYTEIMGHDAHLGDNVMWLLHHGILDWLLARDEPASQGARFLLYGAAEHGGEGLLTWKRRAGFSPARWRDVIASEAKQSTRR